MFLRSDRRRRNGEIYDYWTLVESVRTARGPRQRIVATLGKLAGLDEEERAGWEEIGRLLDGEPRSPSQGELFEGQPEDPPEWAQVNLRGVRVERVREFGKVWVWVGLALWRRLGLYQFFADHVRQGREQVEWATVACILSLGRFCAQVSELALGERWYATTALEDLGHGPGHGERRQSGSSASTQCLVYRGDTQGQAETVLPRTAGDPVVAGGSARLGGQAG